MVVVGVVVVGVVVVGVVVVSTDDTGVVAVVLKNAEVETKLDLFASVGVTVLFFTTTLLATLFLTEVLTGTFTVLFFSMLTVGFGIIKAISPADATLGVTSAITAMLAIRVTLFISSFRSMDFPGSLEVRRIAQCFCYRLLQKFLRYLGTTLTIS